MLAPAGGIHQLLGAEDDPDAVGRVDGLFMVYGGGSVQQIRYLRMDPAAGHVPILCHRHLGMPEVIGADPGRRTLIVDQGGHRLAERRVVASGTPRSSRTGAPLLAEVVRVPQCPRRGWDDHHLVTEIGQIPPLGQCRDRQPG